MELYSCPADEVDYVDAFLQNLRCDIRSRLKSKGRPSTRRLSDAFYDAKLEECMISMEEAFKKFEARNLGPRNAMAEKGPVEEVLELEGSSCYGSVLQRDEDVAEIKLEERALNSEITSDQIKSEIETSKVFDELTEPILNGSPSIDQVLGNIGDDGTIIDNAESVDKVLESDEDDYDSSTADEISLENASDVYKDDLVLQSEITRGWKEFSVKFCPIYPVEKVELLTPKAEVQFMNMAKELVPVELGMVKVAYQVFDEMPRLSFVEPKIEISGALDHIPPVACVPRVFDPCTLIINVGLGATTVKGILGVQSESKNGVNEAIWGTTISVAAGWELAHPNSTVERKHLSLSFSRNELLGVASNHGRYTDIGYMLPLDPLFDCVLQIFDPGSCSLVVLCDIIDLYGMIVIIPGEPDHELWISTLLCTFDPGGVSWFRDNCDSLLFTNDNKRFDKYCGRGGSVLAYFRNGKVMLIATTCSKSKSGQCLSFATFLGQCMTVPSFVSNDMVFIFDPGGCGELVKACKRPIELLVDYIFWTRGAVQMCHCA